MIEIRCVCRQPAQGAGGARAHADARGGWRSVRGGVRAAAAGAPFLLAFSGAACCEPLRTVANRAARCFITVPLSHPNPSHLNPSSPRCAAVAARARTWSARCASSRRISRTCRCARCSWRTTSTPRALRPRARRAGTSPGWTSTRRRALADPLGRLNACGRLCSTRMPSPLHQISPPVPPSTRTESRVFCRARARCPGWTLRSP